MVDPAAVLRLSHGGTCGIGLRVAILHPNESPEKERSTHLDGYI